MKNNFNLMRLIFSIGVVFSHSFGMVGRTDPNTWGLSFGGAAVHGFFIVSGYLITKSFARSPSVGLFVGHRALRVLPGLAVVLLVMHLAWLACDRFPFILHNGPLWTLSWEGVCYGAVACFGALGLLNERSAPALFATAWIVYLSNASSSTEAMSIVVPMLMLFLGGGFIAIMEHKISVYKLAAFSAPVLALLFIPGLFQPIVVGLRGLGFAHGTSLSDWQIHEIPYLLTLPFMVVFAGRYAPVIKDFKTDISYGVYIYGWPTAVVVGYVSYKHFTPITNPLLHFAIVIPLVLVLAFASWFGIERPALSLKRRIDKRASVSARA